MLIVTDSKNGTNERRFQNGRRLIWSIVSTESGRPSHNSLMWDSVSADRKFKEILRVYVLCSHLHLMKRQQDRHMVHVQKDPARKIFVPVKITKGVENQRGLVKHPADV